MAELSVLICTLNDRITTVPRVLLPECEDICYVVSFQYTDSMFLGMVPEELKRRPDVIIHLFPDVGLSANRNNALRGCLTPFAVISDDDSPYSRALYDEILATFAASPQLDIITFADHRLAFRLSAQLPQFDTRFGLGSAYLSCGEEEVFLHQARVFGLGVRECNFASYRSNRIPWAQLPYDKRTRRSWGALQYMKHSTVSAFIRIVWKSLSVKVQGDSISRLDIFRDLFDGLRYIVTHPLNDSVAEEIPLDFQPIDIWRMP